MLLTEKYVNLFTDFGFKKLFGSEPNKDLLINFLNQVLPPHHQIEDLSYKRGEYSGYSASDRKAVFDLYCVSSTGEHFVVEMQKAKQNFFKDRSVFYATFPIQEQAKRGPWDFRLSAVYMVGILDFVFDEDKSEQSVRHEVQLKDQDCRVFYDKLTFIYLEMPNFTKTEEELDTMYDKWLYVLKHLPDLDRRPEKLQERVFEKLFEAAAIAKLTPAEKDQYEDSLKHFRDLKNVIDTSFEEGKEEGKMEGREEGKMGGIVKSLKRGKLTLEEIAEDFEVSVDFITKIKGEQGL